MAWKKLPVITKDRDDNPVTTDRLLNLDSISYFRPWTNQDDGSTNQSMGYSHNGKQHLVDMPLEELEHELDIHTASQKV